MESFKYYSDYKPKENKNFKTSNQSRRSKQNNFNSVSDGNSINGEGIKSNNFDGINNGNSRNSRNSRNHKNSGKDNSQDKTAIVLDLDETVIKSYPYTDEIYNQIKDMDLDFRIIDVVVMNDNSVDYNRFITVARPGLKRFLMYCEKKFDYVCVWTASVREYAEEIILEREN